MFCKNCGSQIDDNAIACPHCGVATHNLSAVGQTSTNGFAIAGFVLSFFFALLGIIFSAIGLKKAKTTGSGKGLAVAGLVISILQYAIIIIVIIAIVGAASTI